MRVLIIYATVEGHTAKIARFIGDEIEAAGHQVALSDVRQAGYAQPGEFDAVVVCGPIHMGHYPRELVRFATDFHDALNSVPSALVTVSLSIASEHTDEREEAKSFPYVLCESTGWAPLMRLDVAGALKYLEYNYFKRLAMRTIIKHAEGPAGEHVDTSKDHELTDWPALKTFVDRFLAHAFK
ncbi:MAG: flavodoxin domain-containing protein [Burkholderiaceae bacterium]